MRAMTGNRTVRTTCPYCGVGCGVLAKVTSDGAVSVRGDPEHPANYGRLCSKGSALSETIDLDGRLLSPKVYGRNTGWDAALDLVATTFSRTIEEYGPNSVAFYVSGQLLTEDYYIANKLMKGFIGTANIDTNSRLCMASSVAGHHRAFGSDTVPGSYEDLELADLVVLVGSNLAWCHPVLYQRLAAAKEQRPQMRVVVVDPRRTMTSAIADLHLPIGADGDVALFAGLLAWLADNDVLNHDYISAHTSGFEAALASARAVGFNEIARQTRLTVETLVHFYTLFATTPKVVTLYSQGVNQSSSGTDKVNAILNCHLATGRIGKPGAGPFSVTGQPNAMGGREVGGLANMLAAHMEIENPMHRDRVQRFWRSPVIAVKSGLKAVEMFRAAADGRIKALWIMATNPADTMPDAGAVEAALRTCPFVVVSDILAETDTMRHADVALPAAGWGEKDGTVTNSERRISRQRPFLAQPGETRPDWWIVSQVAQRMGFAAAFDYETPAEIFAEHAALSAFENDGSRDFDIGAYRDIDRAAFENLAPFQWPRSGHDTPAQPRFFSNGRFFTPDRRARFVAITPIVAQRTSTAFPLILNTGRIRDHWHTMTRTGKSPRLSQHLAEPFCEMHPADAAARDINHADLVHVTTSHGAVLVRALLSSRQARGSIFIPMHWNDQFAAQARVDVLIPAITDPISGQPALKHVASQVALLEANTFGFAVFRHRPPTLDADYWAIARCNGGWRIELGFLEPDRDWTDFATTLFVCTRNTELLTYHDLSTGQRRFAHFEGNRLVGALFLAAEPVPVSRDWMVEQLDVEFPDRKTRLSAIAGRPNQGLPDRGSIVCSCFGVGSKQIETAAKSGCHSVEAIGARLQAGTNCGSCRSEIKEIIDAYDLQPAE